MNSIDNKKNIRIDKKISKEEEKEIKEVVFQLPDNVDEIEIKIKVKTSNKKMTTIDLGLRDPNQIRGWSGGSRSSIYVSQNSATPGYLTGEIINGDWAILLGIYKVPFEGCEVVLEIAYELKSPKWLKGDLHGHSIHSDGKYTLEQIYNSVRDKNLNFIGLTDHNTITQNWSYPQQSDVIFIPGTELTTYRGHCNILGIKNPITEININSHEMLLNQLDAARGQEAKVTINHPNDTTCEGCSWEWGWDVPYDWLEVWNGPWSNINKQTLEWWTSKLATNKRQVIVGGSDTHKPDEFIKHGYPTNWVYTESRSIKGILNAIDLGHLCISYAPHGPFVNLIYGNSMMGDVAVINKQEKLQITLSLLQKGDLIKIISDQGVEKKDCIHTNSKDYFLEIKQQKYCRVEVWRQFEEENLSLVALSNPIYFSEEA